MTLKWNDAYKVNISHVDKQHREIFEIAYQLENLSNARLNMDHYYEINKLLEQLITYAVTHFEDEEKLMPLYPDADWEQHLREHNSLIQYLSTVPSDYIYWKQAEFAKALSHFVRDWIEQHMLLTDRITFNLEPLEAIHKPSNS